MPNSKKNNIRQARIIGLTGMYCAGKNHVAALLEKRGLPVLDVDKLGYKAIITEKEAIVSRFGTGILGKDGAVDRRELGKKVFGRPEEIAALEGIVHPAANRMTGEWIAEHQGQSCVINAALLHRSSAFALLDCIILVEAPLITRLIRAKKRDKLPWADIWRRFKSQKTFTSQYLSGKADIYRVENRGMFLFSGFFKKKLEDRIDSILSGMER
jgi:dephospho-CoA kinase